MNDHVLLQLAVRRAHADTPQLPSGAIYDAVAGWWHTSEDEVGNFPPMQTKKNDIETGEDMKGE